LIKSAENPAVISFEVNERLRIKKTAFIAMPKLFENMAI